MALIRILAMTVVVFFLTRWLRRFLSGAVGQGNKAPSGKPWFNPAATNPTDDRPKLKTLYFRPDPYEVLGLDKGANRAEIDTAYEQLIEENHPSKVAEMSDEIQELAERRTQEIIDAYQGLTEE